MNRESIQEDRVFGTEAAMNQFSCLVFNLTTRVYERKELSTVMEEGLKITQQKIRAELAETETPSQQEEDYDDLLKFYGTDQENECVILMPIPELEQ